MNTFTISSAGNKAVLPEKIYRHEIKFEADFDKARRIKAQFAPALTADPNAAEDGSYIVKSLYFETPYSNDYTDKELGVQFRQKMRLRTYAGSDVYKLEIKSKNGDVATKYSVSLTQAEAQQVAAGDYGFLADKASAEALFIYHQLVTKVYRPLMVVAYRRYAYLQPAGNFRLTFDEDLRWSADPAGLFTPDHLSGVVTDKTVMEVKYDDFVPNWITDRLHRTGINAGESSKYAAAFRSIFD